LPSIKYTTRQEIIQQAIQEIQFDRNYKQGKVQNWKINEDLYYGRKLSSETSRANVDLGQMSAFIHTLLSKIDNPLTFKFTKRKNSQLKRVQRLNALRMADQQEDDWDIKDIVGKKQAAIYGRAIYGYHAESQDGYKANLENVDVYDFLIDPSAGGIDIERAMNMGRYGVIKMRKDIEQGVKDGMYLRTEAAELLAGSGNSTQQNQETTNQNNRTRDQNVWVVQKNIGNPDKYLFWEWYTTYNGDRYYLLLSEERGTAIRVEKLTDIFESNLWPFWTWAAFPDLTEFWTPSFADYVREVFLAQTASINQMLDNAEQINKPQKLVNASKIEDLASLKYQRGGNYIVTKQTDDVRNVLQVLETPSIDTPLKVYDRLESIQEKASGVNSTAKGVSDEDKVGIYEGNAANTADRFGLLNKSYSFGYKRFAKLYEWGVREHLARKKAVDMIGPEGVEIEEVSRRNIFYKNDTFGVVVESSNAELALSEVDKRTKIAFLNSMVNNQNINWKKAFEIQASIAGFTEDEIRQLLDNSDFGDAELMSEADRDLEALLDGKRIQPNLNATTAYKQRFVDYMKDHEEDIDAEQAAIIFNYMDKLEPIIIQNMVSMASQQALRAQLDAIKAGALAPPTGGGAPQGGAPLPPPPQEGLPTNADTIIGDSNQIAQL